MMTKLKRVLNNGRWVLALAFAYVLMLVVPTLLVPQVTYDRWDSYEYFLPVIHQVHHWMLRGIIPWINFHQHLGETLPVNIQAGPFYPPYTVAVGIQEFGGLSLGAIPNLIFAMHLALGLFGLFYLMRLVGVRASLAAAASICAHASGFFICFSEVWPFVSGFFAWMSWACVGSVLLIQGRNRNLARLAIVLALYSMSALGHPQFTVYGWLFWGTFTAIAVLLQPELKQNSRKLIFPLLAAVLTSALPLLPTAEILRQTVRGTPVSMGLFTEYQANKSILYGLLTSLVRINNGFLTSTVSPFLHFGLQASWILLVPIFLRKHWKRAARALSPWIWAFGIPSILFLLFSFGTNAHLYPLTHGIPVWGSFRWPYRFLLFCTWGIGALIGVCSEALAASQSTLRKGTRNGFAMALLALVGLGLIVRPSALLGTPAGVLLLASDLALLAFVYRLEHRSFQMGLFIVSIPFACAQIALCHEIGMRTYPEGANEANPAAALVLDPTYRIMPLSRFQIVGANIRELDLFHSASIGKLSSATGMTGDMVPLLYRKYLASGIDGVLPPSEQDQLLSSQFAEILGIRYAVASKRDPETLKRMSKHPHWQQFAETKNAVFYENNGALKPVYFASAVKPFSPIEMNRAFYKNESARDTALVEDWGRASQFQQGRITGLARKSAGTISFLAALMGGPGFAVISNLYSKDWHASIDGRPTHIFKTNGLLMGIVIPSGAHKIELRYYPSGFKIGEVLFMAGILVLVSSMFSLLER